MKNIEPKKTDTSVNRTGDSKSKFAAIFAPSSTEAPIVYSEDIWDATEQGDELAKVLGGAGQYSQHDINEALAANAGTGEGGAANIDYVNHEGEGETDDSVFNPNTVKGLNTAKGVVKVPAYFYCKITDNYTVGLHTNFVTIALDAEGVEVGDCPIVQVTHKTIENGSAKYSVVYCDYSINIETKQLTIYWNNRINVDSTEPLYVSIIG